MTNHYIAWWNVENLFDVKDAPLDRRPEELKRKIKADLKDWTAEVVDKKTTNLGSVISQMNEGMGPDILGVCEVENRFVLEQLTDKVNVPGRNYQVIHHDMSDKRGIDVAFIYDSNNYNVNANEFFHHTKLSDIQQGS